MEALAQITAQPLLVRDVSHVIQDLLNVVSKLKEMDAKQEEVKTIADKLNILKEAIDVDFQNWKDLSSPEIQLSDFTSSSIYDSNHDTRGCVIGAKVPPGHIRGLAFHTGIKPYFLVVDLHQPRFIASVTIGGRDGDAYDQRPTKIAIEVSNDNLFWRDWNVLPDGKQNTQQQTTPVTYNGPAAHGTVVTYYPHKPFYEMPKSRFVRVEICSYHNHPTIRWNILFK